MEGFLFGYSEVRIRTVTHCTDREEGVDSNLSVIVPLA